MWTLIHPEENVSDYFLDRLNYFQQFPNLYRVFEETALSKNCFATVNLLDNFEHDKIFYEKINYLKKICETFLFKELKYFYLHMVDYTNGGDMLIHKHDHLEDYSFILYLNDCDDGETVLHVNESIAIKPEKNKILFFSSNTYHSSNFSHTKKILVGGLKLVT